jgi:hypothetical protein
MDDNITKIIKERFDTLPTMIQEVILSTHYEETLIEIGKQYNLNVEQLGILERETTLVMMGLTPTKDFETELTHELHVDKLKGAQIVKDINEKIFLKIRELLKLMNTPAGETPSVEETEEIKNTDTQILSKAGIEIIPEKLELTTEERPLENREDMLKKIEKSTAPAESHSTLKVSDSMSSSEPKEETHPMLAQKLSASFQTPIAKTEHTLNNLTSSNTPSATPKIDPYREIPE